MSWYADSIPLSIKQAKHLRKTMKPARYRAKAAGRIPEAAEWPGRAACQALRRTVALMDNTFLNPPRRINSDDPLERRTFDFDHLQREYQDILATLAGAVLAFTATGGRAYGRRYALDQWARAIEEINSNLALAAEIAPYLDNEDEAAQRIRLHGLVAAYATEALDRYRLDRRGAAALTVAAGKRMRRDKCLYLMLEDYPHMRVTHPTAEVAVIGANDEVVLGGIWERGTLDVYDM